MTDGALRDLERAWLASGDDATGMDYLTARARAGQLDDEAVEFLARLGLGPALARLGDHAPQTALTRREGFLFGADWTRVAARLVWERHFLPAWEAARPGDGRMRQLLREPPTALDQRFQRPVLEGLTWEDAERIRRWVWGGDPRAPMLETLLPSTARGLDPLTVARQLRSDLVREVLGVTPPPSAMHELVRVGIELIACEDAPRDLVERVATWLDTLSPARPRRVRVRVAERRAQFGPDLRATWLRDRAEYRDREGERCTFRVHVTTAPDAQGWFARHLDEAPMVSVIHLGERARSKLESSAEVFLAHMAGKKVLDGLLGPKAPRHEPSRACAFDFCREKASLDHRIRAGSTCRECHALLRREVQLPDPTLDELLRILAAARDALLSGRG